MRDFLKLITLVSVVDGKMDSFLYLRPSLTLNEPFHDRPRYDLDDQKVTITSVFTQPGPNPDVRRFRLQRRVREDEDP